MGGGRELTVKSHFLKHLFTFQPKIKQNIQEKECGQCPGIYREKHWTDEWSG